jgi:hypothetical protein
MAKRGWLGWALAGLLGLAWLNSDDETKSPVRSGSAPTIDRPAPRIEPERQEQRALPPSVTLSPPPAAPLIAPEPPSLTFYSTANVRLRAGPSTSTAVVWTVPAGTEVLSVGREAEWHRVRVRAYEGYIRGDFLSGNRPIVEEASPAPSTTAAPLVRQTPARRSGEARRDPYVGTCDCPYDLMRNGRRCGGRSAYSRPGGRSPICYF